MISNKIEQAVFIENRIFINIERDESDSAVFYTDTGGGKVVFSELVKRLNLDCTIVEEENQKIKVANLDMFLARNHLPVLNTPLGVMDNEEFLKNEADGVLGACWFQNKKWRFDYLNKELFLLDSINWETFDTNHIINLGFAKDAAGNHITSFPSLPVTIDGDTVPMLFDTGATAVLDEQGKEYFNTKSNIATSFIVESYFDKWCRKHPEWKVLPKADFARYDMIEVPEITIGNHKIGPVWFTKREDVNFTEYMSQWMDQTVYGALGGSAFQYFSNITIDYIAEKILFEK